MNLSCKRCGATFRPAITAPLVEPVRVACPSCSGEMVIRPLVQKAQAAPPRRRRALIADDPRPFREFLVHELARIGFEVETFESGEAALARLRQERAELVILNVYQRGKLGVEISEEIKADPALSDVRVVLIGSLFRANRFRANPTNLYGADEYIEEQIPAKKLHAIILKLFPGEGGAPVAEAREFDEARRLARLILSDIIIYHADRVAQGIREGTFFELLRNEIDDGRQYYESRVPFKVRQNTEFFDETLQQFVRMKREELGRPEQSQP